MRDLIERADTQLGTLSEEIIRKLSRRQVLVTGIKTLAASVAAISVGSLTGMKEAFASWGTCTCNWIQGHANCNATYPCPTNGNCPSGCSYCIIGDPPTDYPTHNPGWGCSGWCNYSGGQWIPCGGFGACGNGYRVCSDCKCSTCSGYLCTCLSGILCSGCCSPAEVQREMAKLSLN